MNINFELYKVFYHAGKNLSFTRAAESLFVSQSSVSQSIKQLETNLEVRLFHRNRKKIRMTREGEVLFSHISQAYNMIKSGERHIEETREMKTGEIRIGASDTICRYYLVDYIKKFHKKYPDIRINITNQPSKKTMSDIKEGRMDFGIVNLAHGEDLKGVDTTLVCDFQEVAITTPAYLEKLPENPSIRDLKDLPVITLTPNTHTRQYLERFFEAHNQTLKPEFELESVDLIVDLVRIGLGVGFVMSEAVRGEDKKLIHTIGFKEKLPARTIAAVTNENLPLSIPTKHFMEALKSGAIHG